VADFPNTLSVAVPETSIAEGYDVQAIGFDQGTMSLTATTPIGVITNAMIPVGFTVHVVAE